MSQEVLHHSEYHPEGRVRGLKRLVDHLISLAPFSDEPTVISQAAEIIEEMKELATPSRQLTQFEELATLTNLYPDQPDLHDLIDNTAEYLVEEIEQCSPQEVKNLDNIHSAWAVIKAWDTARTPFSEKLCIKVLDNFQGGGRHQLVRAFNVARASEIPFEEALTAVNYEAALSVSS